MAEGKLEWLRTHSLLTLTPNLCNTTIAAAAGCSFYDNIPFVELSERETGYFLAKTALQGKPAASPAIPVPPYSLREVLSVCEALHCALHLLCSHMNSCRIVGAVKNKDQ